MGADKWELPGLRVDVSASAPAAGAPAVVDEGVEVADPPTTLRLEVSGG